MRNILTIASHCVPHPADNALYIDTDSCYALKFNERFLEVYNEACRKKLTERGYPGIEHNGRIYYPGVCEEDGEYTKFVTVGAKRYCCEKPDGSLKLTISGVPKKRGAECLEGNIENFRRGFVFDGERTGKLTHFYQYADIHQNEYGDEIGDSINLVPCDYLLDESVLEFLNNFDKEEVSIQIYDEKEIL